MKKNDVSLLVLCIGLASNLSAEPCVSSSFDRPVPGATDVVTRQLDVQSSAFSGLWQEGRIDGLFYALYANGEGVLRSDRSSSDWSVSIKCNEAAKTCDTMASGTLPLAAQRITALLQLCLVQSNVDNLLREGSSEPIGVKAEMALEVGMPETIAEVVAEAPCGLQIIPRGDEVSSLQRLLVLVGVDPGKVDGIRGELTQAAIKNAIGQSWLTSSTRDVIAKLDHKACGE